MTSDPNLPAFIDDETLRSYLADALPPGDLARVEKALRESADLRARLEEVRQNRSDTNIHTLGAIWRRGRLTCPTRQQLGSYLLDVLEPELGEYLKFHIEVVECAYCQANIADLKAKASQPQAVVASRHNRILRSSQHLLGDEGRS